MTVKMIASTLGLGAMLLPLASPPAAAQVFKCTQPDGKVSFQSQPCSSKDSEQKLKIDTNPTNEGRWSFEKRTDRVAEISACIAKSPVFVIVGAKARFVFATAVVLASKDGTYTVGLQASESSDASFHNDLSGTGIKVNKNKFIEVLPFKRQHLVIFGDAQSAEIIEEMKAGGQFVARARFWPYDSLHDSAPVPLTGFKQALTLADACSRQ